MTNEQIKQVSKESIRDKYRKKTNRLLFGYLASILAIAVVGTKSINYFKNSDSNPYSRSLDVIEYLSASKTVDILRNGLNNITEFEDLKALPYQTLEVKKSLDDLTQESDRKRKTLTGLIDNFESDKAALENRTDVQNYKKTKDKNGKMSSFSTNSALIFSTVAAFYSLIIFNRKKKSKDKELKALEK